MSDYVLAVCIVAALLVSVVLCARDAKRLGKSPWLVSLMVVLLFPVGALVWRAMRPKVGAADNDGRNLDKLRPR
jgi:hypothetical protein